MRRSKFSQAAPRVHMYSTFKNQSTQQISNENLRTQLFFISGMRLLAGVLIQLQLKQKISWRFIKIQKEAKLDGENNTDRLREALVINHKV